MDIGQKQDSRGSAALADNGLGVLAGGGDSTEKAIEETEGGQRRPGGWTTYMAGEAIDLSLYPRLMSLLATTDDLNPHLRSVRWVITLMDELYDARRRAEQAIFNAEEDYLNLDSGSRKELPFPAFAYRHFKNRHGIKHMVRSVCIDLVCNMQLHRKQRPDVEVFARFMEEFYGQKELSFFLDLRTEAHRVARVGARRLSVGAQPVFMTLPDCMRVAKGVFIDSTTLYFRDLISTVTNQMATDATGSGGGGNPTRGQISLPAFLYLAMVCFVSPKEPPEDPSQKQPLAQKRSLAPAAGPGGRRLYVRGRDQDSAGNSPENRARATAAEGGCDSSIAAFPPPSTLTPGDPQALGESPAAATHEVLSLSQVSPSSSQPHVGSPFRSRSPPGGTTRRDISGGSGRQHPRRPVGPTLTSLQSPPILRQGQQQQQEREKERRLRRQAEPGQREGQQAPSTPPPPQQQQHQQQQHQQQQHQQQQRRRQQQHPYTNSPGRVEGPRGRTQQERNNGSGSPTTPTILEWGLNSLLSYVRGGAGGGDEGIRPGRLNAQDAWSAFSPASSRAAWPEGTSPPPSPPTRGRPPSPSARESGRGQQGATESKTEAGINISAAAEGGRGAAARVHDQYQQQPSLVAASTGAVAGPPPSPASMAVADDSHRRSRCALSPLALLARIERRSRSCSRSTSPTPAPKNGREDEGRTCAGAAPAGRSCGRGKKKEREREHGGGGVGAETPAGISPSGVGWGWAGRGPDGSQRIDRVAFADDGGGEKSSAQRTSRGGGGTSSGSAEDDASAGRLRPDDRIRDGAEFSHDVASTAADWLASFEQRLMPCLVAEARAGADRAGARRPSSDDRRARGSETKDGLLPPAISRVLHEEVFRVLEQRRRDLDIVARISPELLRPAVVKSFWMFEESISTPLAHARALSNMGRLLEDRGRPDEAMLCFQEASSADSGSAEALCCKGGNLLQRGDLDGAALFFEGALARDESHWSAWHGLGQVKSAQGKYADAVEALSKWLEGQEKGGNGGESVGGVVRAGGEGGAGGVRRAAAAMAKGLVQLGDAHRKLGQDKEAQNAYERAVSVDEGCSEAHFQLGSLFQARGAHDAEAALRAFALAVKTAAAAAKNAIGFDNHVQGPSGVAPRSFLA